MLKKISPSIECNKYLYFIFFLCLGLFLYGFRAIDYFLAIPGNLGDARFNSVVLEHLFRYVINLEPALWDTSFFYPFQGVLAFSDNHFGSSLFYIVPRYFGFNRYIAFDIWFLIGLFLNFSSAFYILRRLNFSPISCAVGSFVFAFNLAALPKEGHAQLLYRFAIPFAFFYFYKFINNVKIRYLWKTVFWTVFQFYCSIYLGIFLVYLLIACFISNLLKLRNFYKEISSLKLIKSESTFEIFTALIFLIISLSGLFWLLFNYYIVKSDYNWGTWRLDEIPSMLPRIGSYFLADYSTLYSNLVHIDIPMRHEHQMFIGLITIFLCCFGVFNQHLKKSIFNNIITTSFLSVLILIFITLSIRGQSFYNLISFFPGINQIRAVSRIILIILFPVSILAASGIEAARSIHKPSIKLFMYLIVIIGFSLETITYQPQNTSVDSWIDREIFLESSIAKPIANDAILFVTQRDSEPFYLAELDAMVVSQNLNLKTLNGYSGSFPPGYMEPKPCYSYVNRLNGFANYRKISRDQLNDFYRRITVVPLKPCAISPVVASSLHVSQNMVEGIRVDITDIVQHYQSLDFKLAIKNGSSDYFRTVSSIGSPIRMSWRFMPKNESPNISPPPFESRKDLMWDIAPSSSFKESFSIPLPLNPGEYDFEVALVQEGFIWFQDLGLSIRPQKIYVGLNRSVTPVGSAQASRVNISILDLKQSSGKFIATVRIQNDSKDILNQVPLRMSWRFLAAKEIATSKDWGTNRVDIERPIGAGQDLVMTFSGDLPVKAGRYTLEVTIVQDGVAWFHNLSMPIAFKTFFIKD